MKKFLWVVLISMLFIGCKKDNQPTIVAPSTYKLNLSINGNGHIDIVPLKSDYNEGEIVKLQAYPDTLYEFKGWNGSIMSLDNPYNLKMDGDKTILANFGLIAYKLYITVNGKGRVDIIPLQNSYQRGDTVYLQAYPDTLYRFQGWNGSISGLDNPYLLTMDGDKNIIAGFIPFGPDISGSWKGVHLSIDLELTQKDKSISGDMLVLLNSGDIIVFTVSGTNNPPEITMLAQNPDYYPFQYEAQWDNDNKFSGWMQQHNTGFTESFVRVIGKNKFGTRKPVNIEN